MATAFDQAQQLAAASGDHNDGDGDETSTWDSVNFGGKDDGSMGDIEAGQQSDGAPLLQQGNDSAAATGAQQPAAAAAPGQPQNTPMCACLTISYYRPHFDVDTSDVVARLRKAVTPVAGENSLLAEVHAKPDLYGPFWVCTTLIFVIGASANFASWVYWDKDTFWVYDFTLVTFAMGLVYGYVAGLPALVWVGMKYMGVPINLTALWCLYGYSMVPFIPAVMLCTTPIEAIDWLVMIAAFGLSIAVLLRNVWPLLMEHAQPNQTKWAAGVMLVAHLIVAALFKFEFFFHDTKP